MALTATSQILRQTPQIVVIKLTGVSDGMGESFVEKVTKANLTGTFSNLKLMGIRANITGLQIRMFWEGTPNQFIWVLGPGCTVQDFATGGGIGNNAASSTGDVLFFTEATPGLALSSGASYSVVLYLRKV